MKLFSVLAGKILLFALILTTFSTSVKAQLTATGDLVFTGWQSSGFATTTDQFAFVVLKSCPVGTVIKFTDNAWNSSTLTFNNTEANYVFTVAGATIQAGTEIRIICGPPAQALFTTGAVAGTVVASGNFSLPSAGDQMFAYLGPDLAPTVFLSGIHMNVESVCGTTTAAGWDPLACLGNNNTSMKPAALITDANAFWSPVEHDNGRFTGCGLDLSTPAAVRAAVNNPANWFFEDPNGAEASWSPNGPFSYCTFAGAVLPLPSFTLHPANSSICAGSGTSFTVTANDAVSYLWQVNNGGGFVNLSNDATYSGVTTVTLNITNAGISINGYLYRCVATNGTGSTNSNSATLTVTALPINPTLLSKTPATATVADGTPVSATFNPGSGGSGGCTEDYRFTTDGGTVYTAYTPGTNISTTGVAAGSGFVFIEGRRAGCASCSGNYVVLASWLVTPLPAGATTLNTGDIAFTGYASNYPTIPEDNFSFVLLKNIGPGTVINFTDNGWLSTNVFGSGESTATWTSNAAYPAGTEIKILGLTATLAAGGSAGTVTGAALSLLSTGDQVLAYRGSAASPTFISAIHMNVEVGSTVGAWDGAVVSGNASALPTGLTSGVNCIWIGLPGDLSSEYNNAKYGFCSLPAVSGSLVALRAALNNQANWIRDDNQPPSFVLPTGCTYLGVVAAPNITMNPSNASICELANTSFAITATGATNYQWQVDNGGGFVNVVNNANYSGATTPTLNLIATPLSFNGYIYHCIASNGGGSVISNPATLTITALPISPTLLAKTPASVSVADGTNVSATFNAGSGGSGGCTDDYRYTTDGGTVYTAYTPGTNISTTGVAAGSGFVFIEGRRAGCATCSGSYVVLAAWRITPLPAVPTTLNAGDIAFSGYASSYPTIPEDNFSFVLLRNVGPGTVINFTNNGWLSTNVFGVGEQTVTWTAPAGGLPGGTEIKILGLTATRSGGGSAGTVTGTALNLLSTGNQVLAYRGAVGSPTFISAIHMNVEAGSTNAAWDGAVVSSNASALPTGLTSGVNCIWIGLPGDLSSEYSNGIYGLCSLPAVSGSLVGLRAALNNQANWIRDDNQPPSFTLPSGCNYLSALCPTIIVTNPGISTGATGVPFSQTFTASGGSGPYTFTTASTLPSGITLSSGGVLSGTPTVTGTFNIVVTATDANLCSGDGPNYPLVISCSTNTWVGGTNNAWFTPANWSCGTVPVAANDVIIPSGTTNPCVITGGTAQVHNLTINAGASLTNNDTLNINGGGVLTNNGMYKGNGAFTGGLFTNPVGGSVSPGNSPGCLSYGAGYTNLGTLNIEVNGTTTACTDYDQLIVTGTATLGGTLNVTIGYSPLPGDQVTFIDATTVSGTFATVVAPPGWSVLYNSPSAGKVTLTFACPGGTVTNLNTAISYCTIQAAIDAVATLAGHTISVGAGTYNERVTITKGITLQGVDSLTTIIDGTGLPPSLGVGLGSGIRINSGITNVKIKNLRVKNFLSTFGTNANAGIWAQGGNNNLLIDVVSVFDNVGGSGIYVEGAGGIDSITITNSRISGHTGGARGIGIWNGLKTKINISNNHVYGNVCCGIELQTGTSSGVTMNNNNVHDNGDNGMSANGLTGPGVNVISGNTLVNNGRFGMEIKNPDGTGAASGPGSIVVSNNNVSRTNPVVDSPNFRDVAGIAVFRRDLTAANVNVPKGVRVLNNYVSGYVQPNAVGEGYGIVAEGLDHTISTNTLNGNDIGIQRQAGNTPYTALPAIVNGDQAATNNYFGRGNSPITCNVVLTGNIFGNILANGINTRDIGLPDVTNITNNGPICPGGGNAVFTLTGTANAIVTYNINGGGSTTVTLDGAGTGMVTIIAPSMNQTLNLVSIAITGGSCRELSGSSTATVMTVYTSVQDGAYSNPATWGSCPAPNPIPMGVTVNMNHHITNNTTLVNNGTIMCMFDFINTPTGILKGTGTISCKLVNQGTVRPGN